MGWIYVPTFSVTTMAHVLVANVHVRLVTLVLDVSRKSMNVTPTHVHLVISVRIESIATSVYQTHVMESPVTTMELVTMGSANVKWDT